MYAFGLFFLIAVSSCMLYTSQNAYQNFISSFLLVLFIFQTVIAYLYPVTVTIDKSKDELLYFDLSIFPEFLYQDVQDLQNPPAYHYNPTHKIVISHLKQIQVRKIFGDILKPTMISWIYNPPTNIGIQFISDNADPVTIVPGIFSYRRHRAAGVKIAEYLNIPFKDSQ